MGDDSQWRGVVSGHQHVGALKQDGCLWVWGKNGAYELGLGDKSDRLLPVFAFYSTDVTAPTIDSLVSSTHPESATVVRGLFPRLRLADLCG